MILIKTISNAVLNKFDLYKFITEKINLLGYDFSSSSYQVNSIDLAYKVCKNLEIQYLNFKEKKICGILYKGENCTTIGLNNNRSEKGKNFDCMHEIIHYWLHNDNVFYCDENATDYFEWQANEGAAQFLVPYQNFIPKCHGIFRLFYNLYPKDIARKKTIEHLSYLYNVGEQVIEYRLENLYSEIIQYKYTKTVATLNIKSLTRQNLNTKYSTIRFIN